MLRLRNKFAIIIGECIWTDTVNGGRGMEKKSWKDAPLKLKIMVWVTAILLVMTLSTAISVGIGQRTFFSFGFLLENNAACYRVQEAIDAEAKAFARLVREASQENQSLYKAACEATQRSIAVLPDDYMQVGEERYARIWNLRNGYDGYVKARDAFLEMDTTADDYVNEQYRVMEMQGYLEDYALRLVQATLAYSNDSYGQSAEMFNFLPTVFVVLFLITVLLILLVLRTLSAAVIRPTIRLAEASRKISGNDFSGEDLAVEGADEIGELTAAFNRMKHAMAEHLTTLEALHREELKKLELEKTLESTHLEVLKSQVDPHFLFNTLNMISCTARMEKAPTTDRMIVSLGNLFRYNLRTKEQVVRLEQELEMLEDYIYIQNMRHDGRIVYRQQILADPGSVWVPSFLLQPVVENAFVHGLHAKVSGGQILLRIWQEGAVLVVSVADNGKGMSNKELAALKQRMKESETTGRSIGLGNICRRMSILYPDGTMNIYSREGRGTVVQFRIPQKKGVNDEV